MLLSPSCADPLYRRSVRVSMGEVFAVPYARLEPWPAALSTVVREAGFTVLALTPAPDAVPIQELDRGAAARARRWCWAPRARAVRGRRCAAADARVVIPMRRGVDSLNVAAAAAVAFWELRPRARARRPADGAVICAGQRACNGGAATRAVAPRR